MPKPKRIPDGSLRGVSRDIRTVLRWAVCLHKDRSVKISSAYYSGDKFPSCQMQLETDDGRCWVRATTIGRCYQFAAARIRSGEIDGLCEESETLVEGRDF